MAVGWTLKNAPREAGAEPDECYIIGPEHRRDVLDLVIEVMHFGDLDQLEIYLRLGIGMGRSGSGRRDASWFTRCAPRAISTSTTAGSSRTSISIFASRSSNVLASQAAQARGVHDGREHVGSVSAPGGSRQVGTLGQKVATTGHGTSHDLGLYNRSDRSLP